MPRAFPFIIVVFIAALLTGGGSAYAISLDDGFTPARKVEARFFTVSIAAGIEDAALVRSLDVGPGHKILAGQSLSGATYMPDNLGDLLDALFSWSSGVLDMQLYSYRGNIKIVRDEEELKAVYRKLYGVEGVSEKAFYSFDVNTVYITAGDFTKEILGHEVGHAIISNFFVVQPPMKVQEVLAGYIEYQLRKGAPRK